MRRRPFLVAAALVALHLALALLTFEPRPHTGGDNAAYIALGQSLLERGTYTELWDPLEPPHTKYPPVFPGVLALAMLVGLKPWVQLKLVVVGFSAAAVAFSFLWIRARNRPGLALGVAAVLAVAPGVLREGRWVLSDVPFWTFTMVALWAFERLRADDWKRFAVAAAATVLAYFTRSAGLPLVLAALAWLAWRRHWAQLAALAVITGVPALLWSLRSRAFGPSGYVSEFWLVDPYAPALGRIGAGDLLQRMVLNVEKYASVHLPQLLATHQSGLLLAVSAVVILLAAAGWVWRARRARVADLFLPLYLGLIFVWPAVWSGERFLLPALPLLLFMAAEALVRVLRRFAAPASFAAPAGAVALLLALAAPGLADAVEVGRECSARYRSGNRYPCLGGAWQEFFLMAEQADRMLPDGAAVISRKPRLFYGIGGVRSAMYPLDDDPVRFFATLDSTGARYVLFDRLDRLTDGYVRPILLDRAAAFCVMRAEPGGTVLFGVQAVAGTGGVGGASAEDAGFAVCGADLWRGAEAMERWAPRGP